MNYELRIKNNAGTKDGRKELIHNSSFLISLNEEHVEGGALRNVRVLAKHGALHNSRACGFSLLETLVALAVLTAAITGPMSLATVSIRSASLAHNKIIASFLAEEGMELARARRDAMVYSAGSANWLADLGDCAAKDCTADATIDPAGGSAASIISPCNGACSPLQYNSSSGVYGYTLSGGNDSIFTRTIRVVSLSAHEVRVTVIVTWRERFLPNNQTATITTNLSNWK